MCGKVRMSPPRRKALLDRKGIYWGKESDLLFFKKGQTIYFEGSSSQGVFIIEDGSVKTTKSTSNGREFVISILTKGDLLASTSLRHHAKHTNSAVALENTALLFIHKNDFVKTLQKEQNVFEQFMDRLYLQNKELEKRAARIAYKPVRGRLAAALVHLDHKFNEPMGRDHYLFFSRKDLAGLIGSVKETVIRLLSEFKADELIDTDGTKIQILDRNRLEEISEMYD